MQLIPIYRSMGCAEQSQGGAVSSDRALDMFLHAHKIAKARLEYLFGLASVTDCF